MTPYRAALVAGLFVLASHARAGAGTNDILIGLDEKITFDANGQVNGPPGKDAVLVMDVTNPAKPRIRANNGTVDHASKITVSASSWCVVGRDSNVLPCTTSKIDTANAMLAIEPSTST